MLALSLSLPTPNTATKISIRAFSSFLDYYSEKTVLGPLKETIYGRTKLCCLKSPLLDVIRWHHTCLKHFLEVETVT